MQRSERIIRAGVIELATGGHERHPGHWDRIIAAIAEHTGNPGKPEERQQTMSDRGDRR